MAAPFVLTPAWAALNGDINTYALFAYDELIWKGGNVGGTQGHIYGGNVGVNYPGLSPTGVSLGFGTDRTGYMDPGYQLVGDSFRNNTATSVIYYLFANTLNNLTATIQPGYANPATAPNGNYTFTAPIIPTASLPKLPFTPNRALTNNASDLTVAKGTTVTLTPGALRDVRINDGATVNLGNGTYDMRSVDIGKNITINVQNNTIIQVDRGFTNNDGLKLGTNAGYNGGAQLFVGGDTFNVSTERVTNFAHNSEVHVQYFAPTDWLDLGGQNNLYGRFWAERITGDPNNNVYYTTPVPLPTTILLLSSGLLGLIGIRRKFKN